MSRAARRGAGRVAARRTRRGQRGVTLIELMLAMVISSLLIGLVFAIYTRMSAAYRNQSVLSDTQQSLRTAREAIAADVRQAGFMLPGGFKLAVPLQIGAPPVSMTAGATVPAVMVENASEAPDLLRVFYADASARARVVTLGDESADFTSAVVDDLDEFAVGDVVVITAMIDAAPSPTAATEIARFEAACVVQVTALVPGAPPSLAFADTGNPYNTASNAHCAQLINTSPPPATRPTTMVYRFVGRAYRIDPDPARANLGALQRSPSGGIAADDWEDLAFGFTDIQIASRYFEPADATDLDGDGDAQRDWYSGDAQEHDVNGLRVPADSVLTQLTVSLVARTLRALGTPGAPQTPAFIDETAPDHNELGDRAAATADDRHLYRYSTTRIDIRNLGVGR